MIFTVVLSSASTDNALVTIHCKLLLLTSYYGLPVSKYQQGEDISAENGKGGNVNGIGEFQGFGYSYPFPSQRIFGTVVAAAEQGTRADAGYRT